MTTRVPVAVRFVVPHGTAAVREDRSGMNDQDDEPTLDMMFDLGERMQVPEGFKWEIVEGGIYVWPQQDTHWSTTLCILDQLTTKHSIKRQMHDVRIDYPGHLNGFASDVTLIADGAQRNDKGNYRHQDVDFVAEVIWKHTAHNDYGPKKTAYPLAEVPVYLIVNPYTAEWHLHTLPKDGEYHSEVSFGFGEEIDLTGTVVGLTLKTDEFPRD